MAHGSTESRRANQASAIRRWRPREYSTGPRTAEGKARASRNAYRGGHRQQQREAARLLVPLTPRIEASEVEARAEIVRRILARNVELFFRSVELASSETDEWPRVRMSAQPYTLTSRERRSETAARRYAERREILALRA